MREIIVVYPVKRTAMLICSLLAKNELAVSDICALGATALSIAHNKAQCVIVCPFMMKDMSAAELANSVPQGVDIVALANGGSLEYMGNLITLPLPVDPQQFVQTVKILADSRTQSFTKRSRNDKEYIDKAKECLISAMNLSEEEAHKYLQQTSMKTRKSILELAMEILESMA
ncbi:MAG: ANTAR domain-containing protein [Clostridiales bacterium]|nr:ANTAR domain-containing protein [Clostridiales bacterium]